MREDRSLGYTGRDVGLSRVLSDVMTILEGSTFVVSDDIGDVSDGAEGFFADDTRMLSRCAFASTARALCC